MPKPSRRRVRTTNLEPLEARVLLTTLSPAVRHHPAIVRTSAAAASETIPGNKGRILHSQIDPTLTNGVGLQLWKVSAGRPVRFVSGTAGSTTAESPFIDAFNTGRISHSQFVGKSFPATGLQLRGVHLGGGITLDASDPTTSTLASAPTAIVGAPVNSGNIVHSQFNRGGFGKVGLQWFKTSVRGDLTLQSHTFYRGSDGQPLSADDSAPATSATTTPAVQASINTGRIRSSQFNNGGFGDTGLQWSRVRVGGSVGLGAEKYIVSPYPRGATLSTITPSTTAPIVGDQNLLAEDTVNYGAIQGSQVNDGGFGDLGLQWSNVRVKQSVGTSDNNLDVEPQVDGQGPININGLVFGQQPQASTTSPTLATTRASVRTRAAALRAAAAVVTPKPQENDTFNSGRISNSQVNDGGFGDLGAQWRDVAVGGAVSAVHNSLSIEPRNVGQGLITIQNVHFPAQTPASLTPTPQPRPAHRIAPTPKIVEHDGRPVTTTLPRPTTPNSTDFQVDEATNSGRVSGSQFADGGFGDVGLQWAHVKVRGNVNSVHNSLSIQPKGEGLAGVTVQNVSFGDPLPASTTSTATTLTSTAQATTGSPEDFANNTQFLNHQQVLSGVTPDILLQWGQINRAHGLIIVHNTISVPTTSNVQVGDIRFLGVDPLASQTASTPLGNLATQGLHAKSLTTAQIKNSATNSGIIQGNQFADGGIGGIGLQWRNVKVSGAVTVVRNTLSVNVTDNPTGPITISNVTFNSGALNNLSPADDRIIYPPQATSRIHAHDPVGTPLPQNPNVLNTATNSGILLGGQFQAGGKVTPHVDLQWRRAALHGSVTIIDNVLSVVTPPTVSGPITINHVTFA